MRYFNQDLFFLIFLILVKFKSFVFQELVSQTFYFIPASKNPLKIPIYKIKLLSLVLRKLSNKFI